jgi:glycyl-tRNA synthetase
LIQWNLDFDLRSGLELAVGGLPIPASPENQAACLEFITGRLRGLLLDSGWRYDAVDAVLAAQAHNPAGAARGVKALSAWVNRPDWPAILPAYARCVRITRDLGQRLEVNPLVLNDPAEKELFALLQQAEEKPRRPGSVDDFLQAFLPLIPAVNRFFDAVLVMDENMELRESRMALLQRIAALADGAADLAYLEGF